ncbi:MAG TPA: hypothetical protein VMM36_18945 [Opitutaceae bacterium]|nr:hypothetical protein [Opitutaceae bacterium]
MNRRVSPISLLACVITASLPATDHAAAHASHTPKFPPAGLGTVDIVARDYMFEMPARIPSGWTEFRLFNAGMAPHFALISLLPEGRTLADYGRDIGAAFGHALKAIAEDKGDRARAYAILGEQIAPWFAEVKQMGGPGFIEPGGLAITTAKLVPGTYVVECYIKTDDGRFHADLGMVRTLVVTQEDSGADEPLADARITLSNGKIEVAGGIARGKQIVAVDFDEHPEAGLGNDVHLVRLEKDGDLDAAIRWVDWMNLDGLTHHTPARFLGGTQEMPIGSTAYLTIDFEPGDYAWIAESGAASGMVHRFKVE